MTTGRSCLQPTNVRSACLAALLSHPAASLLSLPTPTLPAPLPQGLLAGVATPAVHQCKAVACLKLDQWLDAAECSRGQPALAFVHAYALYKLERHSEAAAALGAAPAAAAAAAQPEPTPVAHLRAQIAYKQGAYQAAAALYGQLAARLASEGEDELDVLDARLNQLASLVSGGFAQAALDGSTEGLAALAADVGAGRARELGLPYELLYNLACAHLDAGDARGAASLLQQSLALGKESLEEGGGSSAAEVQAELAPVRAQAALLLAGARYDEAAGRLYAAFAGGTGGRGRQAGKKSAAAAAAAAVDAGTALISTCNTVALQGERLKPMDLVPLYKRLRALLPGAAAAAAAASGSGGAGGGGGGGGTSPPPSASAPAVARLLTVRQHLSLQLNLAVLLAQLNKGGEALEVLRDTEAACLRAQALPGAGGAPYTHAIARWVHLLQRTLSAAAGSSSASSSSSAGAAASEGPPSGSLSVHVLTGAAALLAEGKAGEAGEALAAAVRAGAASGSPAPPSVAATAAALLTGAGSGAAAEAVLRCSAEAWAAAAAAGATGATGAAGATVGASAAQAASDLAGYLVAAGDDTRLEEACQLWLGLGAVGGAPKAMAAAGCAAAAYCCLRAGSGGSEGLGGLVATGSKYLAMAKGLSSASAASSSSSSSSSASASSPDAGLSEAAIDALEQQGGSAASALAQAQQPSLTLQPAAAVGGAQRAEREAEEYAAMAAAAESRRAKARRRRARRRAVYLEALAARGGYASAAALPKPDPERWVPRLHRAKGVKGVVGKGAAKRAGLAAAAAGPRGGG